MPSRGSTQQSLCSVSLVSPSHSLHSCYYQSRKKPHFVSALIKELGKLNLFSRIHSRLLEYHLHRLLLRNLVRSCFDEAVVLDRELIISGVIRSYLAQQNKKRKMTMAMAKFRLLEASKFESFFHFLFRIGSPWYSPLRYLWCRLEVCLFRNASICVS